MSKKRKQHKSPTIGTLADYLKAWRSASRTDELEQHSRPVNFARVHLSKKMYNRKRDRRIEFD